MPFVRYLTALSQCFCFLIKSFHLPTGRNRFQDKAFELAENYRDFRSLASLCHKEKIYPPEENSNASRIQLYIDKFKEEFASELYQWYIEHGMYSLLISSGVFSDVCFCAGELRTLYALDQPEHLDKFFAEHEYPNVSWIHDFERGRFGVAARSLLSEAQQAPELSSKHVSDSDIPNRPLLIWLCI